MKKTVRSNTKAVSSGSSLVPYMAPTQRADFGNNTEIKTGVARYLRSSPDLRTNIWSISCTGCGTKLVPQSTMCDTQHVTCPVCNAHLVCFFNMDPPTVAATPKGWTSDMLLIRLEQQYQLARNKHRKNPAVVMFHERADSPTGTGKCLCQTTDSNGDVRTDMLRNTSDATYMLMLAAKKIRER